MAKLRIFPHLQASDESCDFGAWTMTINAQTFPATSTDFQWDYATEALFTATAEVDDEELRHSTGLQTLQGIHMVAFIDCSATGKRFTSSTPLSPSEPVVSSIFVPAGTTAKSIRLQRHLVLRDAGERTGSSAHRPGSRLLEEPRTTVHLEGQGSRFPTEAVSFKKIGVFTKAPWRFELDFTDPDEESFMGAARLLVNTDHSAMPALTQTKHANFKMLSNLVLADIIRTSVLQYAANDAPSDQDPSDGSVSQVLDSMTTSYLGFSINEAVDLLRSRPDEFEVRLKDRVEYLKELQ